MNKLEQIAKATSFDYLQDKYPGRIYQFAPDDHIIIFKAGALWLLGQANKIAIENMNLTTSKKQADMRALELVKMLEKVCEEN